MRLTKQRQVILETLKDTDTHPSADKVYERVRKRIPDVSLGTVYRNLEKLSNEGLILKLDTGDGRMRYDGNPAEHHHFACTECGGVYDVPESAGVSVSYKKNAIKGFNVKGCSLMLRGTCGRCGT